MWTFRNINEESNLLLIEVAFYFVPKPYPRDGIERCFKVNKGSIKRENHLRHTFQSDVESEYNDPEQIYLL